MKTWAMIVGIGFALGFAGTWSVTAREQPENVRRLAARVAEQKRTNESIHEERSQEHRKFEQESKQRLRESLALRAKNPSTAKSSTSGGGGGPGAGSKPASPGAGRAALSSVLSPQGLAKVEQAVAAVNAELTTKIAELEKATSSFSPTTLRHLMTQRYVSAVVDGEKRLMSELSPPDRGAFMGAGYSLFDDAPLPPNFAEMFERLQSVERERREQRAAATPPRPAVQ